MAIILRPLLQCLLKWFFYQAVHAKPPKAFTDGFTIGSSVGSFVRDRRELAELATTFTYKTLYSFRVPMNSKLGSH